MQFHPIGSKNVHPEVNAFIYQQLADLQPLLPQGATIGVMLRPETPNEENGFVSEFESEMDSDSAPYLSPSPTNSTLIPSAISLDTKGVQVSLIFMINGLRIEVVGQGEDILSAIHVAKETAHEQLVAINEGQIDENGRNQLIRDLSKSGQLH